MPIRDVPVVHALLSFQCRVCVSKPVSGLCYMPGLIAGFGGFWRFRSEFPGEIGEFGLVASRRCLFLCPPSVSNNVI